MSNSSLELHRSPGPPDCDYETPRAANERGEPLNVEQKDNSLEASIGRQVRERRRKLNMTVVALAKLANLSAGMLSKIENGATSPSLSTLQALSRALHIPVTELFKRFDDGGRATVTRSGEAIVIERRGSRCGYRYHMLGHADDGPFSCEPMLIEIDKEAEAHDLFQHAGVELIYVLDGELTFRHSDRHHSLGPGDSIYFDAESPHGPASIDRAPVRLLSVIVDSRRE